MGAAVSEEKADVDDGCEDATQAVTFITLTLDFGHEQVAVEPRYVMAFHPAWLPNPESPEDPKEGRLVTRVFFMTGMQIDVSEDFDVVAGKLTAWGCA